MSHVIVVSGNGPGAGKSTVAQYLVEHHAFNKIALADKLKLMAVKVTPDGRIDKARDRELLQFLGTDYYRKIDEDYWLRPVLKLVREHISWNSHVVIDDARFENEFAGLQAHGATFIHVQADKSVRTVRLRERDTTATFGIEGHSSENASVGERYADYTIENNRDLRKLHLQLEDVRAKIVATYYYGRGG